MTEVATVGVDLARSVLRLHGVDAEAAVVPRRQLRRSRLLASFQQLAPCLVGMEACAGAHHRAREIGNLRHHLRLMPPACVKACVRRGKTDQADAEAIREALTRPSRRFVPVKSKETQALLMTHKAREFLVRQLTRLTNAIRAHPGEFGIAAPKGVYNLGRLVEAGERAEPPAAGRGAGASRRWATATRGGSCISAQWGVAARRRGQPGDGWLWRLLQRRKPSQAAIALANRMARTAHALLKNRTEFRAAQAA